MGAFDEFQKWRLIPGAEDHVTTGTILSRTAPAPVHVALGDHDAAIARLEMAYAEHNNVLPWIREPLYRPLSPLWDDPRYKDIITRMNVPGDFSE